MDQVTFHWISICRLTTTDKSTNFFFLDLLFGYITILLYGMNKDKFYSQLFRREIYNSEPEFSTKVLAESLYRYYKLEEEKCTCMQCRKDLEKIKTYLKKNVKGVSFPKEK